MSDEKTEGQDVSTKKLSGPNHVNVKIQEVDGHYLANFHFGPPRLFHNVEELLVAIEVEVKRISHKD